MWNIFPDKLCDDMQEYFFYGIKNKIQVNVIESLEGKYERRCLGVNTNVIRMQFSQSLTNFILLGFRVFDAGICGSRRRGRP